MSMCLAVPGEAGTEPISGVLRTRAHLVHATLGLNMDYNIAGSVDHQ